MFRLLAQLAADAADHLGGRSVKAPGLPPVRMRLRQLARVAPLPRLEGVDSW